jgi:hypothetical protein
MAIGLTLIVFLDFGDMASESIQRRSFKFLLWKLGFYKACPYYGDKIISHGFYPDERYTCENTECRFNEVE